MTDRAKQITKEQLKESHNITIEADNMFSIKICKHRTKKHGSIIIPITYKSFFGNKFKHS